MLLHPRRAALPGETLALLALLALGLLAGGCRGQAETPGGPGIEIAVLPTPPAMGPAEVTVRLAQPDGAPVKGARVRVEGNMSHAGMVPVLAEAAETEDGRYVTRDFRFSMGGDWLLTVQVETSDGRKAERTFRVDGVAGGKR